MTRILLAETVPAAGTDGKKIIRNSKTGDLEYAAKVNVNERQVEVAEFNKKEGSLIFVRKNGETFKATGFLTEDGLGQGERGKKGKQGRPGRDGEDGHDGDEGDEGCPGEQGPKGKVGRKGRPGVDAEKGTTGGYGCPGAIGSEGEEGDEGHQGYGGPTGPQGYSCVKGPKGETGLKGRGDVVVRNVEPTEDNVFIWGAFSFEEGGIVEPGELSGFLTSVNTEKTSSSNPVEVSGTHKVLNLAGGVGPYSYAWSGDYSSQDGVSVSAGGTSNSTSIALMSSQTLYTGQTIEKSGTTRVVITDEGQDSRPSITLTAPFSLTTTSPSGEGGGGGGGCLVYGTKVLTPEGEVDVETLSVGDIVIGRHFDSMPGSLSEGFIEEQAYLNWSTREDGYNVDNTIYYAKHSIYSEYILVNTKLKITKEHPILINRIGIWEWRRAEHVKVGDKIRGSSSEDTITSVEVIEDSVNVVTLDVEYSDTYYADGILVHNVDSNQKH